MNSLVTVNTYTLILAIIDVKFIALRNLFAVNLTTPELNQEKFV